MSLTTYSSAQLPKYSQALVHATENQIQDAENTAVVRLREASAAQQYAFKISPDKPDGTNVSPAHAAEKAWDLAAIEVKNYLRMFSADDMDDALADLQRRANVELKGEGSYLLRESLSLVHKEHDILPAIAEYAHFDLTRSSQQVEFGNNLDQWSPQQWDRFDKAIESVSVTDEQPVLMTTDQDANAGQTRTERNDRGLFRFTGLHGVDKDVYAYRPLTDDVIHDYVLSDGDWLHPSGHAEVRVVDLAATHPKDPLALNTDNKFLQDKIDLYNSEHDSFLERLLNSDTTPEGTVRVLHSAHKPISIAGVKAYLAAEDIYLPGLRPYQPGKMGAI